MTTKCVRIGDDVFEQVYHVHESCAFEYPLLIVHDEGESYTEEDLSAFMEKTIPYSQYSLQNKGNYHYDVTSNLANIILFKSEVRTPISC